MESFELLGLAAAAAYYLFFIAGSVSLGYVFLRLTQPEIRAAPRRRKLVLSLAVGAAFVFIALAADYAINGGERVETATGMTPAYALATAALCAAVFKIVSGFKLRARKTRVMEVAVAAPPAKQGAARLLPFVQEVRKYEPAPALEPMAEPEVETIRGEAIQGEAIQGKAIRSGEESDGGKSVREKLAELKAKGMLELRGSGTKEGPQPQIVSQAPLEPLKIEAPALALPEPAVKQEPAKQEKQEKKEAKEAGKEKEKEKGVESFVARVFGKPRYAKPEAAVQAARATTSAFAQKTVPRPPTRAAPPQAQERKGGGVIQKIFGAFSKPAQVQPRARAAPSGRQPPKKPWKPPSEEQEVEVILSELHLVAPPTPQRFKGGFGKPSAVAAGAAALPQATAAAQPAQRHRLYLERRGAAEGGGSGGAGGGVRIKLEQERLEKQELNALFSDVYSQIEKPGKPGAARAAAQKSAAGKSAGSAVDKPLSMNDLFGTEAAAAPATLGGVKPEGGASVFSQLESISAGGAQPQAEAAPQVQVVKMRVDQKAGCPHCGAKNVRVVFCPYCGSGMCANCTPALKPTPEAFVYTCPKCGEEVPVAREKKT